jgi:hypothetical protein
MFTITQDATGYTVTSMPYYIRVTFDTRASAINYIAAVWETVLASVLQQTRFNRVLSETLEQVA